jgi:hypothetical protein
MPISSTITAIFLKRYLIYQHKVSESAFFSPIKYVRGRFEMACRKLLPSSSTEFYWASTFLSLRAISTFWAETEARMQHQQQQTTTAVRESGVWS